MLSQKSLRYSLFIIFIFSLAIFFPTKGNAKMQGQVNMKQNPCIISIDYTEPDLQQDIQDGLPYEYAFVLFDHMQNRMRILYDSQGNNSQGVWMQNVNPITDEPGNQYFSQWKPRDDIRIIESMQYALRSVHIIPCPGSYHINAAPDSFVLHLSNPAQERYELYRITYFD